MNRILLSGLLLLPAFALAQERYATRTGEVTFFSETPMENIDAVNHKATSVIDLTTGQVQVSMLMKAFEFEKALMQEHFNENYVESKLHPNALFEGRIIEAVDLTVPGTYKVRAKGRFTMHGIARERNIPCVIVVGATDVSVQCAFDVPLADHGIRIPRVVHQKLAPTVRVNVDLRLVAGSKK